VNAAAKLGAYGVLLVAVLGGGAAIGAAVGPIDEDDGDTHDMTAVEMTTDASTPTGAAGELPGGVVVSQAGYTVTTDQRQLSGDAGATFQFQIIGPDGRAVRDFELRHERELHLILVDTELDAFAHLHPTLGGDGTWSVELPALEPGGYRAIADFAPTGGPDLALGLDLAVPGEWVPSPLPPSSATDEIDGYEVTFSGTPSAGTSSEVTLTVTEDGQSVTDLEPYLGASGHLVALRAGDLAYLHVHPIDAGDGAGPDVSFAIDVPSPGDYRLFFDFAHDGEVRTADFTVTVSAEGTAVTTDDHDEGGSEETHQEHP
jgi:hypothetical protein